MNLKRILILVAIILLLAGGAVGGVYYFFHSRQISYNGKAILQVDDKVTITRDTKGIPLITCQTTGDLYFSLGYLHAQDRLDGITWLRALATGDAHEFLAEDGDTINRLAQGAGFVSKAKELFAGLPDQHQHYLNRYCSGINEFLGRTETLGKHHSKRWKPEHVLAILLMRDWVQSFIYNRENIFRFPVKSRTYEVLRFFPGNLTVFYQDVDRENVAMISWLTRLLYRLYGPMGRGYGFAIPASVTADEKSVLIFGYDVSSREYPPHYPFMAQVGQNRMRGVTINGLPFVIAGDNGSFRFAGFSLMSDNLDLVKYRVRTSENELYYYTPYGWKKLERSGGREKDQGVLATDYGPVLNDVVGVGRYRDSVIAASMVSPGPSYVSSLFSLLDQKDINTAVRELRNIDSSPRSYLMADNDTMLRIFSGRIRQRPMPYPFVPFYPGEAWLPIGGVDLSFNTTISTNGLMTGSDYYKGLPLYLHQYCMPQGTRYTTLEKLVTEQSTITEREVRSVMKSTRSALASRFIFQFSSILKRNPITSSRLTRIYLENWNHHMMHSQVAPTLYNVILRKFIVAAVRDDVGEKVDTIIPHLNYLVPGFLDIVEKNSSKIFDNLTTDQLEDRDMTFDVAFLQSLRDLNREAGALMEGWSWGTVTSLSFPFSGSSDNIVMDFLEHKPVHGIEGGFDAPVAIKSFDGFKPVVFQGSTGYFSENLGSIWMYHTISTDPHSRFHLLRKEETDNYFDLQQHDSVATFKILPPGN